MSDHAPSQTTDSQTHGVRRDSKGRHVLRAALVGVLAGLMAVGFRWALAESERARGVLLEQLHTSPSSQWYGWTVLPLIGLVVGSVVGFLVVKFAPDAPGSGIPHLKGVLLHVRQMRWKSLLPIKFIGGVLGIGAGLSMGREGPTVQMGAAVGRAVADILKVPERAVPQLLSCGAGAGIAAAFNAPLAGFLFVIEELHRELSARTFAGALVAALAADIVARALAGELPSFAVSGYSAIPLSALPIAGLIGVLGGAVAVAFNYSLLATSSASHGLKRVPSWLKPGIACAICGLVAWWLPEAVGGGHLTAERLLTGHLGMGVGGLALLLGVKFILTNVSYASGAPGGIFAPMLLLGAISGAIIGGTIAKFVPGLQTHVTACAILGMAAMFTGSVRAPLTGIVLIVEMTGNYQQLLALGIVCLTADLTAGALRGPGAKPIYESLLEADLRRRPSRNEMEQEAREPRPVFIGVQRGSQLEGKMLRECGFPMGCLVVGIERGGREILPQAGLVLHPGDHLMVMVPDGPDSGEKAMSVVRLATGL